jgi:hypothetical protein
VSGIGSDGRYISSTAVLHAEVLKLVISIFACFTLDANQNYNIYFNLLYSEFIGDHSNKIYYNTISGMKIRVEFDLLIFDCMYVRNIYTYKKIHIYVRIFVCMQLLELVLVFIDFRSTRLQVYVCYVRAYIFI